MFSYMMSEDTYIWLRDQDRVRKGREKEGQRGWHRRSGAVLSKRRAVAIVY